MQKCGREGGDSGDDIIDVLISHAINNINNEQLLNTYLGLLLILGKYNNIRKNNIQGVLHAVA